MEKYLDFLAKAGGTGGKEKRLLVMDGKVQSSGIWGQYKSQAEQFICSCAQKSNQNVKKTPGGLLWFLPWNNNQYVATATFVMSVYSNYLSSKHASLQCTAANVTPDDLISVVHYQVDCILGSNPKKMSYIVGFGTNFPQQIHHRAASIVLIKKDKTPVGCKEGFQEWFYKNAPNSSLLVGAVVNLDENDNYEDSRSDLLV
ncbi:hypothetical protein VNO78_09867 [Psophocarpus tetragonolobus]|uniref:cellulase n=1 Tax=Psophocarpus tetragonolobus TaxID=3891 RepID=A0AAN9XTT2_PSOTE